MGCVGDFVVKEFRQIRRDRKMIPFLLAVPVMQLLVFGFAVSADVKHLRLAVCDYDRTPASRSMIEGFSHTEYFDLVSHASSSAEAIRHLDSGYATLALVIPRDFQSDLRRGTTVPVQVMLDGSDSNAGTIAAGYVARVMGAYNAHITVERARSAGSGRPRSIGVNVQSRIWYNPEMATKNHMVPGVMCVVVGLSMTIASALALVREREQGTMEQLMVTPVRPWELMLGKLLPYMMVGYFDLLMIVLAGATIFGVPLRGSLAFLLGIGGIFLIAQLGVGLLISTVSRNQQQAMMTAIFFLMPNILLSGFMFPIANMPIALQYVTCLLPMRYFLVVAREVYMKGSGAALLWDQVLPLTVLAVAIVSAATVRFRKHLD